MVSEPATSIRHLEATARWTAAVRAAEQARADRLFDDPWAEALAGPEGRSWIDQRAPDSVVPIVLRTRYFDDWLGRIGELDSIRQVVLLAAGLDTRSCRLDWPSGTRVFELDRPAVLRYKEEILAAAGASPRCSRTAVEADLTGAWAGALVEAGFDPSRPSGWLLEGLLFYLPGSAIARVLDAVTALSPAGSQIGFDIVNSSMLTSPWTRSWVEMQADAGAPWIGTMDDPVRFLAERGWRAALTQAGQPDANHGRWTLPVIPTTMPEMPHNWYVTGHRIAAVDSI
jgi:methyltransferase (TIGR00027 family)